MSSIDFSVDAYTGLSGEAPPTPLKPLTVTVAMARHITGLSRSTVYVLIRRKKLTTVKVGTRTLITYASLEALLLPPA